MKFHEEGILKKWRERDAFAFIPVALPHCISPPLSLPLSLSPTLFSSLPPLLPVSSSHITSVPPVVQVGITQWSAAALARTALPLTFGEEAVLFSCCQSNIIGSPAGKHTAKVGSG